MQEIAEVYARALFEAAKEHGVLDRIHDELELAAMTSVFAAAVGINRRRGSTRSGRR